MRHLFLRIHERKEDISEMSTSLPYQFTKKILERVLEGEKLFHEVPYSYYLFESLISQTAACGNSYESTSTIGKRLQEQGMRNDEDARRKWRLLLFSTDQIEKYISGVVLIDETLRQQDDDGKLLIDYLKERCILPGIRVDCGLVSLPGSRNEVFTQGMGNLGARLAEYKQRGCEFARWRCVFRIGENTPSQRAIRANAEDMARFASICQSHRICPLIEPEVISEGNHDIQRCEQVTETVLSFVFRALNEHQVFLEGTVLKPNMVTDGISKSQQRTHPAAVGAATVIALQRTVPPCIPGIALSSGGQTEDEATENLRAIVCVSGKKPWYLTFAFGRALQASAMRIWRGEPTAVVAAQMEFFKRVKANGEATCGGEGEGEEGEGEWEPTEIPTTALAIVNQEQTTRPVKSSPAPEFRQGDAEGRENRPTERSVEDEDVDPVDVSKPAESPMSSPNSSPAGELGAAPGTPSSSSCHECSQRHTPSSSSSCHACGSTSDVLKSQTNSPHVEVDSSPAPSDWRNGGAETEGGVGMISRRVAPIYNPDQDTDAFGHKPELLPGWRNGEWNKSIVGYKSFYPQGQVTVPSEFRLQILKDYRTSKDVRISDSLRLPIDLALPLESKTPTIIEEVTINPINRSDIVKQ